MASSLGLRFSERVRRPCLKPPPSPWLVAWTLNQPRQPNHRTRCTGTALGRIVSSRTTACREAIQKWRVHKASCRSSGMKWCPLLAANRKPLWPCRNPKKCTNALSARAHKLGFLIPELTSGSPTPSLSRLRLRSACLPIQACSRAASEAPLRS